MKEFELSKEQLLILNQIYSKRFKLLSGVFTALPVFLWYGLRKAEYKNASDNNVVYWTNGLLIGLMLFTLALLWLKKVRPIKKDIEQKSGVYVPKVIIRKNAFEHVNRFYIFFDDPELSSKEVHEEEFFNYREGDVYLLPLGKHSKLVLDGFMNYNLF